MKSSWSNKTAPLIKRLCFNDGTQIVPKKINLIIGPNNSGKSRVLKEIRSELLGHPTNYGLPDYPNLLLSQIEVDSIPSLAVLEEHFGTLDTLVVKSQNGWHVKDYCNIGMQINPDGSINRHSRPSIFAADINSLRKTLENSARVGDGQLTQFVGPLFVNYSGTEDRLLLSAGEPARGVGSNEYNTLSSVLDIDPYLSGLSHKIKSLFDKDVILDSTTDRQVVVPLVNDDFADYRKSVSGECAPDSTMLNGAKPLREEGDGFRSFVAVLLSLLANRKPVYLLDEPEAFLHPPYAYEMGCEIASMTSRPSSSANQLFIATHSSYLVRGILSQARQNELLDELVIIRLTRENDSLKVHDISAGSLDKLVTTTGFTPAYIDALFSKSPVLVEAPRDAELYGQLATKLLQNQDHLFITVNGKQNFNKHYSFYKNANTSPFLIADFDLLKSVEMFSQIMKSADVPEVIIGHNIDITRKLFAYISEEADIRFPSIENGNRSKDARDYITKQYKKVNYDLIDKYEDNLSTKIVDMISELIEYGILVIQSGTMETILPELNKTNNAEHSDEWYYAAISFIANADRHTLESNDFVRAFLTLLHS